MKVCPQCGREFGFLSFISRCGSDTLIRHPQTAHPREHLCDHCHAKFWISYNHEVFRRLIRQYVIVSGSGMALFIALALGQLGALDPGRFVALVIIALFITIPLSLTYAKYQSATLLAEI